MDAAHRWGLMPHWSDIPIYVIDFEGSAKTGIIEFGVVELCHGSITSTADGLCAPLEQVSLADTRLHGIAQRDVEQCPPFSEQWEHFRQWRGQGVFGAHHATIEQGLLKQQWSYPPASPDHLRGGKVADWGPWVDTRRLYEVVYPGLESYQLGALVTRFSLESALLELAGQHCPDGRRKAHCALYDAIASALLLLRLFGESGFEDASIAWLLEHSLPSAEKKQAARQGDLFE